MAAAATSTMSVSGVPENIINDEELNAAIASMLPAAYNFEILKSVHHIRIHHATSVALQMPEGLTLWATAIADILERFTGADMTIMGDVTYGACCVDDYTALALGCDLLIHYGHSCLVPVDQTRIRTLYVFVEIALDPTHLAHTVRANFPAGRQRFREAVLGAPALPAAARPQLDISLEHSSSDHDAAFSSERTRLALVGTVQFISAVQQLYDALSEPLAVDLPNQTAQLRITGTEDEQSSASVSEDQDSVISGLSSARYDVIIPQIKPLSPGEVLGCTSPRLDANAVDAILYVGDGRFHLESIMIANPRIPAFRYDPYDKRFMRELYDHASMRHVRSDAVSTAQQSLAAFTTLSASAHVPPALPESEESSNEVAISSQSSPPGWAVILGTLGRQGSVQVLEHIRHLLSTYHPHGMMKDVHIPSIPILLSELSPQKLSLFGDHVSTYVQTSCPRLSIDWGYAFPKPLLSPYEAAVALGTTKGWNARVPGLGMQRKPLSAPPSMAPNPAFTETEDLDGDYPMDFYANDSRGPWTPRHGMQVRKPRGAKSGKSNLAILKRTKARLAAQQAAQADGQAQQETPAASV